jgi:hypothetical protein
MYERLASIVTASPVDAIGSFYLEDIALCATWYESHEEDAGITERFSELKQAFDHWVRDAVAPRTDTEGFRQQPLIRELIGELTEGHVSRLERDELDLLYFTVAFARRSGKLDIFRRVLSCTAPYMNSIERVRKKKSLIPGCPNLGNRYAVVDASDLQAAELRDVKTFGGLTLPIRGPIYVREGGLKIMSDIPAGCTVAVDKGSCCVRGNVEGILAATESIDITDNISGVAISRCSSIGAKVLLDQSTLVSKEDTVRSVSSEGPKLAYAARKITIRGDAIGGRYFARKVEIGGDMVGGDLYSTERATARSFITTDGRPLRVCLLRGLSCKDYGEVLSTESNKLLNTAMKLRQRLNHLEGLGELAEQEADDLAGNILMYVLGEGDSKDRINKIQKRRRRLSFLDRLLAGIRALVMAAEDRINNCEPAEDGASGEDMATLDELRQELTSLSNEGSIEPELHEHKEDIIYLGRKLQRRGIVRMGLEQVLDRLLMKDAIIREWADTLASELLKEELEIERVIGRAALLERARAECSRVEVLMQLVAASRKRPTSDIFKQRLNDRQVKLLQRTMENRNSRASSYHVTCRDVQHRIEEVRKKMWTDYKVSLPNHLLQGWAVGGAQIEGRFSADVLICPWRHLMDDPGGSAKILVITGANEAELPAVRAFHRTEQSTVEEIAPNTSEEEPISISI